MGPQREKRRRRFKTRRSQSRSRGGKKIGPVPVQVSDSAKRPDSTSSSDDENVKRIRMTDTLRVESLVLSHSVQKRYESGTSPSSSSSPSSSRLVAMEEEASRTAVIPTTCPVDTAATSGGGAMNKLTDSMKLKVTGYIELLKRVDQPSSDPNDKSWITLFVSDMCSGGMKLTTDDVLEWIEKLPNIFTPEAIDVLRQHYNRLRALEEEKNAVHQDLKRVLSELDGYEADDDSADDDEEDVDTEKSSADEEGFTSDTI